ncbi:hypothetical protein BCV70DRAFT_229290 [Testicularia cyperi]|uniref:Fe2OG dioxygenase domain-containing protein n=1 Tax=Testicularia cyperi TaxID=1882483 RepID=A0A317XY97_9BASI|nr:hypothetical protein BCV70DRAFT_229290 [Testicularia cyperi]
MTHWRSGANEKRRFITVSVRPFGFLLGAFSDLSTIELDPEVRGEKLASAGTDAATQDAPGNLGSTKRRFQATLFNVKFGAQRGRLPPSKSDPGMAKRTRSQATKEEQVVVVAAEESDSSVKRAKGIAGYASPAYEPKEAEPFYKSSELTTTSSAPKYHHRGPFNQVTRQEFCDEHRVHGLPDADIFYKADFIDPRIAEKWRQELDQLPEWYRPKLKVYGREITQSREIAAYATAPGLSLQYSGHPVEMHAPFPPLLNHIASMLSTDECLGSDVRFNHCMLNRYDDGSIYIGRHSDNIENQVIVTVSLGANRSWIMERKYSRKQRQEGTDEPKTKKRWTLENGSLLVMQGATQRHYTHEIPKELKVKGPRISITFRQLVYDKCVDHFGSLTKSTYASRAEHSSTRPGSKRSALKTTLLSQPYPTLSLTAKRKQRPHYTHLVQGDNDRHHVSALGRLVIEAQNGTNQSRLQPAKEQETVSNWHAERFAGADA